MTDAKPDENSNRNDSFPIGDNDTFILLFENILHNYFNDQ